MNSFLNIFKRENSYFADLQDITFGLSLLIFSNVYIFNIFDSLENVDYSLFNQEQINQLFLDDYLIGLALIFVNPLLLFALYRKLIKTKKNYVQTQQKSYFTFVRNSKSETVFTRKFKNFHRFLFSDFPTIFKILTPIIILQQVVIITFAALLILKINYSHANYLLISRWEIVSLWILIFFLWIAIKEKSYTKTINDMQIPFQKQSQESSKSNRSSRSFKAKTYYSSIPFKKRTGGLYENI